MNASFKRTVRSAVSKLPGSLPRADIPNNVNPTGIATAALAILPSVSAEDFTEDALWRDSFALSGTLRTFFGASTVAAAWKGTSASQCPAGFTLTPNSPHISLHGEYAWIDAGFTFETSGKKPHTTCSGFISLIPGEDGKWKIWLLRTILENLKGHGNVDVMGPKGELTNGIVDRQDSGHFDAVVVGGGQSGLATAGRLEALDVSYVMIDKYRQVGDNWNMRYDSLKRKSTSVIPS